MTSRFVLAGKRNSEEEPPVRMKGRGLFFLLGLLLGLVVGYGASNETVRTRTGEIMLQAARQIDEGVHTLLVKIRNRAGGNAERGIEEDKTNAGPRDMNSTGAADKSLYIREFVTVLEVTAKVDDASKGSALVSGKVKNSGHRTPSRVEATIFFLGPDTIAFEAQAPIVRQTPLAPGSTQEFLVSVQNVPANWVPGRVRVAVTDIAF